MGLKCPFCKDPKILPVDKKNVAEHMIVTKDHQGVTHVHGPIGNKAMIQNLVTSILKEAGIGYSISPGPSGPQAETAPKDKDDKKED
jgi:hypothetical protein